MKALPNSKISDTIDEQNYKYFLNWLNSVLREMVELPYFKEDYNKIAIQLNRLVKPTDIKNSINYLLKTRLIYRDEKGQLHKKTATISTGELKNNPRLANIARRHHKQMLNNAKKTIEKTNCDLNNFSSTTIPLSEKNFKIATQKINNFRREILQLAKKDDQAENITQFNINLFPITHLSNM